MEHQFSTVRDDYGGYRKKYGSNYHSLIYKIDQLRL
jgi:hypothetical protein